MNEGIENALNVIVTTTGSSGNMKKELKTTIFYTVSTLRKLFAKLLDANESKDRKITELERQVANTNAVRGEVTGRTSSSGGGCDDGGGSSSRSSSGGGGSGISSSSSTSSSSSSSSSSSNLDYMAIRFLKYRRCPKPFELSAPLDRSLGREAEHSPSCSAKAKNEWSCRLHLLFSYAFIVQRDNFIFLFSIMKHSGHLNVSHIVTK